MSGCSELQETVGTALTEKSFIEELIRDTKMLINRTAVYLNLTLKRTNIERTVKNSVLHKLFPLNR